MRKSEIPNHDSIVVEYGSPFGFGSETVKLTKIKDESPSYMDTVLEITGYDENNQKYRLYLDVNKIELVNDKNGNFVGSVGSIYDIYEPLEE